MKRIALAIIMTAAAFSTAAHAAAGMTPDEEAGNRAAHQDFDRTQAEIKTVCASSPNPTACATMINTIAAHAAQQARLSLACLENAERSYQCEHANIFAGLVELEAMKAAGEANK